MTKRIVSFLAVVGLWAGITAVAQGPLTPLMNLRTVTDEAGALMVAFAAQTGGVGPLTPMANLRGRTDANGYLQTTWGSGDISAPTGGSVLLDAGTAPTAVEAGDGTPSLGFVAQPGLGFIRSEADHIELIGPDESVTLVIPRGTETQPGLEFQQGNGAISGMGLRYLPDNNIIFVINEDDRTAVTERGIIQAANHAYCFGSDNDPRNGEEDACFYRVGADEIAFSRLANGNTIHIVGTTDNNTVPVNYERLAISHDGATAVIDSQAGGTGTATNLSFQFEAAQTLRITPVVLEIEDNHYIEFEQNSDPATAACDSAAEHGRMTVNDGTAGTAGLYVCDQAGATTGWVLVQDLSG